MSRHYLDHASTTPTRPEAAEAAARYLRDVVGDPARVHAEGLEARVAIEEAREQVAALVGARSREVVFTASATEACNAAVAGATERGPHVVVTAVEHSCVRAAADRHDVTVVPVDGTARVDPDAVLESVTDRTGLVCVQLANHEVGTVQPVAEVAARCRERGVLVLADAATAAGHVPLDFAALGADLVALSGHKLGAPPGVGCLLVRRGLRLAPFVVGADQERARRAGFETGPAIVGFGAAAAALAAGGLDRESAAARALTDEIARWADAHGDVVRYGPDRDGRVPHLICLGVPGVEAEAVLVGVDRRGVAVHSGSACSSEVAEPSPVLEAMGVDAERSVRLSVGATTSAADVTAGLEALEATIAELRALRAPAPPRLAERP